MSKDHYSAGANPRQHHPFAWTEGPARLDLANLHGVTTGNLNKAVDRNRERFPDDFMFRLRAEEGKKN